VDFRPIRDHRRFPGRVIRGQLRCWTRVKRVFILQRRNTESKYRMAVSTIGSWISRIKRPQGLGKARSQDAWFSAHYNYATDAVIDWLASELQLEAARLLDFGCGDGH